METEFFNVSDSLADLCAKWQAMYEERKQAASALWDRLYQLTRDERIPAEVRKEIRDGLL